MMTRALLIVAILMAMLVVPIWLNRDKGDSKIKAAKREAVAAKPAQPAVAVPPMPPAEPATRPIGYGLSFAFATDPKQPPNTANISCHGEPAPQDRPHQGSCNPYQGDTSCRTVLPVLCLKPGSESMPAGVESGFYKGWTGGTLAASQPVMGAIIKSEAEGTTRCEAELGTGWRMAEFHDGQGGWGLQGVRGSGLAAGNRYWVHVNDQPGNCWNSKP